MNGISAAPDAGISVSDAGTSAPDAGTSTLDAGASDGSTGVDAGTPDGGTSRDGGALLTQECRTGPLLPAEVSGGITGARECCTRDGVCHLNAPVGTSLQSLWGVNDSDVWAVGTGGVSLHWNGRGWTFVPTPTGEDLFAVWARASNDV